MPRALANLVLALAGLLCAAGIGAAAYYVSRDSVGLPVTKLQPKGLAPASLHPGPVVPTTTPRPTTTVTVPGGSDDRGGGSNRSRGHGDDD
ncbi:MAG TPA: hypothetical protein VLU96_06850 [Gaiellaceae bacterium]|nr:hypothetical protein [Gaiellaceae bacterium]